MPEDMPEDMPDRMPEDMSDRMPEDLPARKCINVMVGITRSKVILVIPLIYITNLLYPYLPGPFKYLKVPIQIGTFHSFSILFVVLPFFFVATWRVSLWEARLEHPAKPLAIVLGEPGRQGVFS
jgi:hypothetical protein